MPHRVLATVADVKCLLALVALSACSDPNVKPIDASTDGPKTIDARAVDAGVCGADVPFTGELIDWDSTDATFCGVFNATLKVRGSTNPLETHMTPPNGRVVMCVPNTTGTGTLIDITVPTGNSPCLGMTSGYAIRGIAWVNPAVEAMLGATNVFSARAFTTTRQTSFYTQIGAAYDPTKGGLYVHVVGATHDVAIDAAHDAAQSYNGTTWAAGATGGDVFFPNVAPGMAKITAITGVTGTDNVPIEANALTYVTIVGP
jgi:hypothetical protein